MIHQKLTTKVVTDISTGDGCLKDKICQKISCVIDMNLYWVRNRFRQGQFLLYWAKGKDILAYYLTKNHPNKHHREIRSTYLVPTTDKIKHSCYMVPSNLIGCIESLTTQGNGKYTESFHPTTRPIPDRQI